VHGIEKVGGKKKKKKTTTRGSAERLNNITMSSSFRLFHSTITFALAENVFMAVLELNMGNFTGLKLLHVKSEIGDRLSPSTEAKNASDFKARPQL
jgi:hypothetical protein